MQRWLGHHKASFTLDTYIHLLNEDVPQPAFFDTMKGTAQPEEMGNGRATQGPETGRELLAVVGPYSSGSSRWARSAELGRDTWGQLLIPRSKVRILHGHLLPREPLKLGTYGSPGNPPWNCRRKGPGESGREASGSSRLRSIVGSTSRHPRAALGQSAWSIGSLVRRAEGSSPSRPHRIARSPRRPTVAPSTLAARSPGRVM